MKKEFSKTLPKILFLVQGEGEGSFPQKNTEENDMIQNLPKDIKKTADSASGAMKTNGRTNQDPYQRERKNGKQ